MEGRLPGARGVGSPTGGWEPSLAGGTTECPDLYPVVEGRRGFRASDECGLMEPEKLPGEGEAVFPEHEQHAHQGTAGDDA